MAQKKTPNPATAYRSRNLKEQNKQASRNPPTPKKGNLVAKIIVIVFIVVIMIIFYVLEF